MHCYFVLAGDASIPILYHVERVRDGKSFVTRTVQARQRGKAIFTTTCSFMREGSAGKKVVEHAWGLPSEARLIAGSDASAEKGKDEEGGEPDTDGEDEEDEGNGLQSYGPFVSRRLGIANGSYFLKPFLGIYRTDKTSRTDDSPHPHMKRTQQWIRARGRISPSAGPQAHLSALAYMSDSWFIGTVSRVHNLWPFGRATPSSPSLSSSPSSSPFPSQSTTNAPLQATSPVTEKQEKHETQRQIGMMVSLDHTIYFHRPRDVAADEWMFSEMESPWAGEGRGLVLQRIWDKQGRLLASCVQEVSLLARFVELDVEGKGGMGGDIG